MRLYRKSFQESANNRVHVIFAWFITLIFL